MMSSALAGLIARTICHPIDTIKGEDDDDEEEEDDDYEEDEEDEDDVWHYVWRYGWDDYDAIYNIYGRMGRNLMKNKHMLE